MPRFMFKIILTTLLLTTSVIQAKSTTDTALVAIAEKLSLDPQNKLMWPKLIGQKLAKDPKALSDEEQQTVILALFKDNEMITFLREATRTNTKTTVDPDTIWFYMKAMQIKGNHPGRHYSTYMLIKCDAKSIDWSSLYEQLDSEDRGIRKDTIKFFTALQGKLTSEQRAKLIQPAISKLSDKDAEVRNYTLDLIQNLTPMLEKDQIAKLATGLVSQVSDIDKTTSKWAVMGLQRLILKAPKSTRTQLAQIMVDKVKANDSGRTLEAIKVLRYVLRAETDDKKGEIVLFLLNQASSLSEKEAREIHSIIFNMAIDKSTSQNLINSIADKYQLIIAKSQSENIQMTYSSVLHKVDDDRYTKAIDQLILLLVDENKRIAYQAGMIFRNQTARMKKNKDQLASVCLALAKQMNSKSEGMAGRDILYGSLNSLSKEPAKEVIAHLLSALESKDGTRRHQTMHILTVTEKGTYSEETLLSIGNACVKLIQLDKGSARQTASGWLARNSKAIKSDAFWDKALEVLKSEIKKEEKDYRRNQLIQALTMIRLNLGRN